MVRALDGDSTMTSLVPPPVRAGFDVALAVLAFAGPVFVFAVSVLGGNSFPVLASAP